MKREESGIGVGRAGIYEGWLSCGSSGELGARAKTFQKRSFSSLVEFHFSYDMTPTM